MATRFCGRWAVLSSLLLAAALPASAAQMVIQPVRLPSGLMAAPMVGTHLGALTAPGLRPSLTPSLGVPSLNSSLAPRVQTSMPSVLPAPAASQVLPSGYSFSHSGIIVPTALKASALGQSVELGKAVAEPQARPSQILSNFYEGSRAAAAAVDLSPVEAPAAPAAAYLAETRGLSGAQLLGSLHQITGRRYQAHEYRETSQYIFSVADSIVSHGVRGVVDLYSGIFVPGTSSNGGDYAERGDQNHDGWVDDKGMNIEHTWPQSFFGKSLPMRSDAHHLSPTFQHPNSMRSNLPFGEVEGSPEYSNDSGAKEGGGVFEPPDFAKGIVARRVLYFYTRYYDRNIMQGAYNHGFFKDRIGMFLRWSREHPPTADELRRNDLVEKWQGNRNPFVDDPALADRIGAEGFGAGPGFAKAQPSVQEPEPYRQSPVRDQEPQRKHGKNHGNKHHGNDRRYAAPAAPGRLSPLDFALN